MPDEALQVGLAGRQTPVSKQAELLIERLGTEEVPDEVLDVMYCLVALGEPAVVPLISAMLSTQRASVLRQRAVGMFPEFIKDARAVSPIISLLRDADAEVRWAAVQSLEEMREVSAIPELEYVAAHDMAVFFPMPDRRLSVGEDAANAAQKIRAVWQMTPSLPEKEL